MKSLLEKLNIQPINAGACIGPDGWLMDPTGKELVSYSPTTGEALAKVIQATPETYEKVASTAQQVFLRWRELPAPKRGEVIRDLGAAMRELKEPLGDLVTVEMGKIRMEGYGEVQEMIDICDFAVGQSWRGRKERTTRVITMIALQRKTLVVCKRCHVTIHAGKPLPT